MAGRDYYAVLGVPRTAQPDEIKKAFRNLAMRHHPDRNPDDPAAELKFREAAEAYKVLSDPTERMRYDRLGPFYRPDGRPPSPDDINAFVSDVFSGLFKKRKGIDRGDDLRYTLSISLADVSQGTTRTVEILRRRVCKGCSGRGAPEEGLQTCASCKGSGKSSAGRIFRSACPHCDGTGKKIVQPCGKCGGAGVSDRKERLQIRVPAGVATGQKLKVRGKGNEVRGPSGKGKAGDLYVLVNVEEHPLFRRRGTDLFCELPLSWSEAALGAEVDVPTLGGKARIRIPAGTPSEKVFRLAGRGLPSPGGKRPGDLHLKVIIEVPSALDSRQKKAIRELYASLGPDSHPLRQAFDAHLDPVP